MSAPVAKNCMEAAMIEMTRAALLLLLFAGAARDIEKREIPLYLPVIGLATGLLFRALSGFGNATVLAAGCLPGLVLLAAGYLSKEAVGYGDGVMVLCAGIFLPFSETLMLTILSLLLAAGGAGILLLAKKMKRKETLPFLPFLLAGYVVVLSG